MNRLPLKEQFHDWQSDEVVPSYLKPMIMQPAFGSARTSTQTYRQTFFSWSSLSSRVTLITAGTYQIKLWGVFNISRVH